MAQPLLSLIVPTYEPGPELPALLAALRTQRLPPGASAEILLVDSSPDPAVARSLGRALGARVERVGGQGFAHGRTRNQAAGLCRSEFVAFFTQDALPADDAVLAWLLQAVRGDAGVAGAYARQLPRPEASARTRAEVLAWFEDGGRPLVQEPLGALEWARLSPLERYRRCRFDNVASLIRRSVLKTIAFPDTYFGEDIEWGAAALRAGWKLLYEPRARVLHSHDRGARYELARTVNCHARLARLFGLRTVPTLARAASGLAWALSEGVRQTLAGTPPGLTQVRELARLPGREGARAFGQWAGGWLGARRLDGRWHFRGI